MNQNVDRIVLLPAIRHPDPLERAPPSWVRTPILCWVHSERTWNQSLGYPSNDLGPEAGVLPEKDLGPEVTVKPCEQTNRRKSITLPHSS